MTKEIATLRRNQNWLLEERDRTDDDMKARQANFEAMCKDNAKINRETDLENEKLRGEN